MTQIPTATGEILPLPELRFLVREGEPPAVAAFDLIGAIHAKRLPAADEDEMLAQRLVTALDVLAMVAFEAVNDASDRAAVEDFLGALMREHAVEVVLSMAAEANKVARPC